MGNRYYRFLKALKTFTSSSNVLQMAKAKSAIRKPVFNKVDTLQGFQGGAQEDTCGNRSGWYPSLCVAYIDKVEEPSKDASKKINQKVYYSELVKAALPKSANSSEAVQNSDQIISSGQSDAITRACPILPVAFQQLIAGSSQGHGNDGDDTLIKAWKKVYGVNIANAVKAETYSPEELANQITAESKSVN
ncbi:Callose synthase 3 [Camellia lanceoleosa]|uniref:Callose synthase 3 n=1 Tax=Camellia lanceoleosa TaxID=1840588 RepID=A0ACC0GBH5_9ERIC|nr:Callose synthase 3 [Camellia lanceoleosa]